MVTERKETKQMQSTFEKLGGTYRQEGDYLLPNVEVPESPANNAVFNLCCSLCTAFDRKAFLDGLQYGAHLMKELL